MRKFYRFEQIGRRTVLQLFTARPEDSPCCILWERVRKADVPVITRELRRRGHEPFAAQAAK